MPLIQRIVVPIVPGLTIRPPEARFFPALPYNRYHRHRLPSRYLSPPVKSIGRFAILPRHCGLDTSTRQSLHRIAQIEDYFSAIVRASGRSTCSITWFSSICSHTC